MKSEDKKKLDPVIKASRSKGKGKYQSLSESKSSTNNKLNCYPEYN